MEPSKLPSAIYDRLHARALRLFAPKPSLMTLPVEVRLRIYEIVLDNTSRHSSNHLALLRICRQMLSECYPISLPYTSIRFDSLSAFLKRWRALDLEMRKRFKYVTLHARSPLSLYELPGAIQACCGDLQLKVLTMELDIIVGDWFWETNVQHLSRKIRTYLKSVENIDTIRILVVDGNLVGMRRVVSMILIQGRGTWVYEWCLLKGHPRFDAMITATKERSTWEDADGRDV